MVLISWKSFLQAYSLSFHPLNRVFRREKGFKNYAEAQFIIFVILCIVLLVTILRTLPSLKSQKFSLLFF